MANFVDYVKMLEDLGLMDVLLPFLLIFTIAFAVLQKSKILGEKAKRFNVILSLVIAFATIIPHVTNSYPPGSDVVDIINKALPNVSVLMIASMMTLLLIGVFGSDVNVAGSSLAGWVVIFAIAAVGYTFFAAANGGPLSGIIDAQTRSMLVAILVFGIVVAFITGEDDEESEGFKEFIEGMGKVFGGDKKH